LIKSSPVLSEIEPLSQDLYTVADIGIQALDAILAKTAGDRAWVNESRAACELAKKSKGHAELALIPAVEKLVQATLSR
jgi:hypothetical protein